MESYSKVEEIMDKSDDLTEVMAQIPHWIVRAGMMYAFIFIASIVAMSWFIRYPDVLTSEVVLTSSNPPARIIAKESGKLSHITFKENSYVQKGTLLGIIENPATSTDVLQVRHLLQAASAADLVKSQYLDLPDKANLGELQQAYTAFYRAYNELKLFNLLDPVSKEISSTRQEVKEHLNLMDKQGKEKDFYKSELDLIQKDFDRNIALYKNNVIADKQLEDKERELLQAKRSFEQLESGIAATKIKLAQLEKTLALLEIGNREKRNQYELNVTESYKNVSGAIAGWEQKYLLTSPIEGKVTYLTFWSSNQHVNTGDEVMVIVPDINQAVIGKIAMPVRNSGKVKIGQQANIYLKNYPYQEFGTIRGQVKSISLVPKDNVYVLEIALPQGLQTSYHKKLDFKQEMQGNAEIITEELRLLERIFYQLRAMGKNS